MGLFNKKKPEGRVDNTVEMSGILTEGLSIRVLGSGCAKCNALEDATKEALKELNLSVPVGHVTDFAQIAAYGVMSTPALVINEKVVLSGRTAKKAEVQKLIEQALA